MFKVHSKCSVVIGWLHFITVFASCCILGTYARIGIQALSNYEYSFITPGTAMWPNFTSSMIMGICQILNEEGINWFDKFPNLFIGITNGFCGSFSSYSTMIIESFLFSASLNVENLKTGIKLPSKPYGIMEFISVLFSHLFISMSSYLFGRELAKDVLVYYFSDGSFVDDFKIENKFNSRENTDELTDFINSNDGSINLSNDSQRTMTLSDVEKNGDIDNSNDNNDNNNKNKNHTDHETISLSNSEPFVKKIFQLMDILLAVMAIPLIIAIVVLSIIYDDYSRGSWTLSAIFVLFGSSLRYYVSNIFNSKCSKFPIGTFAVNQSSVLIYCFLTIVERGKLSKNQNMPIANTLNKCHIVSALITGFCGGLSTISTFVNEGYHLPFRNMLFYYLTTVITSISLCVIIMGSYAWTIGFTLPMG